MTLFNPGAQISFPLTSVFDGAAPGAFSDLDISAITGARRTLVLLSCNNKSAGSQYYWFRRKGEALTSHFTGVSAGAVDTGGYHTGWFIVATDASGVLEWMCSAAGTSTEITIEAIIQ